MTEHLTVVCDTRFACQRLCCICTEICRVTVWRHSSLGRTADRYIVSLLSGRDLRGFVIRFDFESYVRFEIRFVLLVRFEIFESSALSIIIRKETIGGG